MWVDNCSVWLREIRLQHKCHEHRWVKTHTEGKVAGERITIHFFFFFKLWTFQFYSGKAGVTWAVLSGVRRSFWCCRTRKERIWKLDSLWESWAHWGVLLKTDLVGAMEADGSCCVHQEQGFSFSMSSQRFGEEKVQTGADNRI